jgi:hypothetical protein
VKWAWLFMTCMVSSRPNFLNFYVLQRYCNAKSVFLGVNASVGLIMLAAFT